MDRLQKVIAQAGVASRRKAEEMIAQGRVKVDGVVITEMGYQPKKGAVIEVDGKKIQRENKVYYVMNKKKNTICSAHDEHGRPTILDNLEISERVFSVGRLDFDTTGVLILTNDGDFANQIIHPRYHIKKKYEVTINGILTAEMIKEIEKGVPLEDGITLPAKVWVTNKNLEKNVCSIDLTIQEGRNRQIKRMIEHYGFSVKKLNRKSIGFLTCDDLKPGEYRILKPFEVKQLLKLANEK